MALCKEKQKDIPDRLTWGMSSSPNWLLSMWFVLPPLYLGLIKMSLGSVGDCCSSWTQCVCLPLPKLSAPQYISHWWFGFFFSSGGGILCFVLSFWRPLAYCCLLLLWGWAFRVGFVCASFDLDVWPTRNGDRFTELFFGFLALFCQCCKKSHSLLWKNASLILDYR